VAQRQRHGPGFGTPLAASIYRRSLERDGAFVIGTPAVGRGPFLRLVDESRLQRPRGWPVDTQSTVSQSNWRAPLGDEAIAFLSGPQTLSLLRRVTGSPIQLSPEASCYTYYDSESSFCGIHRDRADACSVTLLLCLEATAPASTASPGMALFVFGTEYRDGDTERMRITSRTNRLVVLRGADVFHGRPHLAPGERVIVLTACYGASRRAI
jgi:hypothetical protein